MRTAKRVSASSLNATTDSRAILAACNNADWYAVMFDLHGLRYCRDAVGFLALDPPPPFHSWMTFCNPNVVEQATERVRAHAGEAFGLKDGFDVLDLAPEGLQPLFAASWIWRDAAHSADTTPWTRIRTPDQLDQWQTAWNSGTPMDTPQFPDLILDRVDVAVFGRSVEGRYDAGVIANLSENCVGLSNAFGRDSYAAAASLCHQFGGGRPVVGYEHGDNLVAALDVGFTATGPLRIWTR